MAKKKSGYLTLEGSIEPIKLPSKKELDEKKRTGKENTRFRDRAPDGKGDRTEDVE